MNNTNEFKPYVKPFVVNGAMYTHPNFKGTKFGRGGERNFGLILEPELAEALTRDGWDVRWPAPDLTNQRGEPLKPIIYPRIKFFGPEGTPEGRKNPMIIIVDQGIQYKFGEDRIDSLDDYKFSMIDHIDAVIGGWWSEHKDGTPYIKAACNNLRIVLRDNPNADIYRQWNQGYEEMPWANMGDTEVPFK